LPHVVKPNLFRTNPLNIMLTSEALNGIPVGAAPCALDFVIEGYL